VIIVAAVGQMIGAFRLLGSIVKTAGLVVKGFFDAFKLAGTVLTVLRSIGVVLFEAVAGLATFVAGLVGLPVAIVVGIAAALVAAGVAIFVFWDDIKAAAIDAWDDIKAGASVAADVIEATWTALVKTFDSLVWEPLKASTAAAWEDIKTIVSGAIGLLVVIGNRISGELKAALASPAEALKSLWDAAVTAVLGSLNRLLDGAKSILNGIVSAAKAAARAIASAFNAAKSDSSSSSSSSSGAQIFGRARGGPIRGPGTSRRDSILAWLSD
jgi:phage-related protein